MIVKVEEPTDSEISYCANNDKKRRRKDESISK